MSVRARGTAPRAASRSPWQNIKRLIRYRLVIPLKRGAERPSYTARGTAVGIFWAFTPLIPAQMYLLGLTWLVVSVAWYRGGDLRLGRNVKKT